MTLKNESNNIKIGNLPCAKFISTMGHELRSPLNAILGFTGTLLMKLPGPLNKDQEDQLNIIKKSALFQLTIINDLIELAKIELGTVTAEIKPVDCHEIVRVVLTQLEPMAKTKNVPLIFKNSDDSVVIHTDQQLLQLMIEKLVTNAIQYTEMGEVNIQIAKRATSNGQHVSIDVIDTGMGIKAEDQVKLFQAFPQLTSGKEFEGVGLGLYYCSKIAELINAKIDFATEHGKGSRFSIHINRPA